jgi:putative endonuclease
MIWHTYILECRDGSYYVGISNQLIKRIERHNNGDGAKYTKYRRPVKLMWQEEYISMAMAMRRENEIKKWSHEKKKRLIVCCSSLNSGRKKK